MSQDSNYSYDDIYEMLREVHTSWSKEVMDAKGEIIYKPGNDEEVKFTRNQLNEIWNLGFDDEALVNYYGSLIEVLDEYEENAAGNYKEPPTEDEEEFDYSNKPSYAIKRIKSIVFCFLFLLGLSYILVFDQYSKPDISYEQEWFVTEKAAWGIGGALAGWILAFCHFQPNVEQTETSITGIKLMISIFPGILYMSTSVLLFFYSIDHKTCLIMQKDLEERRESAIN